MTTTNTEAKSGVDKLTDALLILIVLAVALMAGAASFNHVHDWTMHNSPKGTADWFGWANAVITELIPTAALIIIAKRLRHHQPIGYPMFLLLTAVGLSLTAQLAVARPTVFGWMVSALPALAFFALSKLVFSTRKPTTPTTGPATTTGPAQAQLGERLNTLTARLDELETLTVQAAPATQQALAIVEPAPISDEVQVPAHLVPTARFAVTNHEATTGRTITAPELAVRMSITPDLAGRLLTVLDVPKPDQPAPVRVNGTPVGAAP